MCTGLFKKSKVDEPVMPTKEESVSSEDVISGVAEQQKKKRGFTATNPTGGAGVTTDANIKKTQLGM